MVLSKLETKSLAAQPPKCAKPVKPIKRAKPPPSLLDKLQRLEKTLGSYAPVCTNLFAYVALGSLMSITALIAVSFLVFCMGFATYLFFEGTKTAVVWFKGG